MKPLPSVIASIIMAASFGSVGALPASADAVPPGANHQPALGASHRPKPVSTEHYKEGGLRVTVLKYARGAVPYPRGVVPNSISPGPCSVESSVGFGVEDNGEYEVYCYDGHGQLQVNLYNVETLFAYQGTSGEVDVDGHNRPTCTAVNDFSEYQEIIYNPLAHVCWLEM
jgi:hypothetical protein